VTRKTWAAVLLPETLWYFDWFFNIKIFSP